MRYRVKPATCPDCGVEHEAKWIVKLCSPCVSARRAARCRLPHVRARINQRRALAKPRGRWTAEQRQRERLMNYARDEARARGVPVEVVHAEWGIEKRAAGRPARRVTRADPAPASRPADSRPGTRAPGAAEAL